MRAERSVILMTLVLQACRESKEPEYTCGASDVWLTPSEEKSLAAKGGQGDIAAIDRLTIFYSYTGQRQSELEWLRTGERFGQDNRRRIESASRDLRERPPVRHFMKGYQIGAWSPHRDPAPDSYPPPEESPAGHD